MSMREKGEEDQGRDINTRQRCLGTQGVHKIGWEHKANKASEEHTHIQGNVYYGGGRTLERV